MDGSPVLRQQSQNTIRSDILRTKSEQNKITADSKSSKMLSLPTLQHSLENQDPINPGQVHPPHVRLGASRLPVLVKSLHLHTPKEFTHNKWEKKALPGKARTKKSCTRPVPFNLYQPKSTRLASENPHPNAVHPTRTSKHNNDVCSSQTIINRNSKHSRTLQENVKAMKSSSQSKLRHSHKTSATVSKPGLCALNSTEKLSAAESCSKNMNLLSLKDTSSITNVDNFQHDHAALLSILQNKGVTSTMTSQSKQYNYLPQRVSVMKSCQKPEPNAGSIKTVRFSPDHGVLHSLMKNEGVKAGTASDRAPSIYTPMRVPVKKNVPKSGTGLIGSSMKAVQFFPNNAALQSILQNEVGKAIGSDGVTPRNSVCPVGRSPSIYSAQRVTMKKNLAEASPEPAVATSKQTPVQKWTPQRVTRHQATSSSKWHTSQPSPYVITPGLRGCKANLCPKQEVVQKLFEEDEEKIEGETMLQTELPPNHTTCKGEMQCPKANEKEGGLLKNEEQTVEAFIQNPERDSVIFFSTGKKQFRNPRFKKPENSNHKQHNAEDTLPILQQNRQIIATKDLLIQTDVINPAVSRLRKHLPLVEELRLDEEVTTYTVVSVPTMSGFHTPRPHCENPVATILHFEESTRFVPISFDTSPVS